MSGQTSFANRRVARTRNFDTWFKNRTWGTLRLSVFPLYTSPKSAAVIFSPKSDVNQFPLANPGHPP